MGILVSRSDPTTAPARDIELFRQRVVDLGALLTLEEQLARGLVEAYTKAMKE